MPVFFVPPECVTPPTISITGNLLIHLRDSLRITVDESLWVGNGQGTRYRVEIIEVTKRAVTGRILETIQEPPRHTPRLILGQSLLKGEKMDWVIQKATELGVDRIVPIHTRHGVVKIHPERMEHQKARWERIALEAAQQSERWTTPAIDAPTDLQFLCFQQTAADAKIILSERSQELPLSKTPLATSPEQAIVLLIGPEGGWDQEELHLAREAGFQTVTLGQRILRAETASLAAISIVQSRLGGLG